MLKTYYYLAKPGIVYGNALPALAGFLLASGNHINVTLLIETILGLSLVIASACVWNNLIDRNIDAQMKRTKRRALVNGKVSIQQAALYATILGLVGFGLLNLSTNPLTVFITIIGYVDYVILYGLAKRGTVHSTVIGSISGAVPPVVGYVAVTNHFNTAALLLFLILVLWQMPHFYAIAIYRYDDYKAAGLPILTVKRGFAAAKLQILVYIFAFTIAASLLSVLGYASYTYRVVMLALSGWWLYKSFTGLRTHADAAWARNMFRISLIIITIWSLLLILNTWLP